MTPSSAKVSRRVSAGAVSGERSSVAGQVCDEASDMCVECLGSSNCSGVMGVMPGCAGNVCVECDTDAICYKAVFCNGAETCV
eukprot:CAMPEP_0181288756 /NCGR_PEP_ID=MMETSP1101-20121128/511_1 /TAXON_ID=46948 /ORGANISM="Rhodomonas abbreviata, Strain Caron Lab Isolate" /LENGTH=82 /DNA_ID=CAMNT_0023392917 /DNA_START=220 /DNA_END=465 /DNA_ORIENTATION=-